MRKTRRTVFIALLALLLISATMLTIHAFDQRTVVTSTPTQNGEAQTIADEQERITDSAVPLAAPIALERTVFAVETEQTQPAPTAAPTLTTPAPADPTPDPVEPTQAPVDPTPDPVEPTQAPVDPTPDPAESTEAPTEAPAEPTPSPVVSTAALRLLERANTLLAQYNACTTTDEKRALLGASNNSLGNDAIRAKLLSDLGGSWEQLEDEIVDSTQYQQDKTLYVQVYFGDVSTNYVPVVYTTQNADLSGNQWSTNLVYHDETGTWMEYTQKHPYNDSRVGFYMTSLYNNEDGWEELKDTMEASPVWEPVVVPEESDASAASEDSPGDEAPEPPSDSI